MGLLNKAPYIRYKDKACRGQFSIIVATFYDSAWSSEFNQISVVVLIILILHRNKQGCIHISHSELDPLYFLQDWPILMPF